jgi:hypothetical protein
MKFLAYQQPHHPALNDTIDHKIKNSFSVIGCLLARVVMSQLSEILGREPTSILQLHRT